MKSTKLLGWFVLAGVGTLSACGGGVTPIGSGDEEPGGGSKSVGGSSSMGATANVGATSSKGGSVSKGGTGMGGATGVEPGGECKVDFDCEVSDPICVICDEGGYVCPKAFCAAGKCVESRGSCSSKCEKATDCPVADLACTDCGDGSTACPQTDCVMNQCQTTFPGCGSIDPCKGLGCGTECKSCGPDGVCAPNIASYCNADGKCQPGLPQCAEPGICKTAMDCGEAPPKCVPCGNDTCAAFDCLEGKCVFTCPANPEPQCKVSEDCPPMDAVCKLCPDSSCAVQACLQSSCELVCPL